MLIPGTKSVEHLRENLASCSLTLPAEMLAELDGIAGATAAQRLGAT
jgi:pyridoxine 4-dehydrogenase